MRFFYTFLFAITIAGCAMQAPQTSPSEIEITAASEKSLPGYREIQVLNNEKSVFIDPKIVFDNSNIKSIEKFEGRFFRIQFNEESTPAFYEFTKANAGKKLAFIVDDKVYALATLHFPVKNGKVIITGDFDQADIDKVTASF